MGWLFWVIGVLLLVPAAPVAAWGPGMHLDLGLRLLEMSALSGGVLELLRRHRTVFLYGSVVADVVVGKELVKYEEHSHNWEVAARLARSARDDPDNAFALGYWTHLAADTVAHNIFVPRQIFLTASSRKFGHGYWELRAESTVGEDTWGLLDEVTSGSHDRQHALLKDAIRQSPLPISWSRWIQRGFLSLSGVRQWRRMVEWLDRVSRYELPSDEMDEYRQLCLERMVDSIGDADRRSAVMKADPTGGSLDRSMVIARQELQRRIAQGELSSSVMERFEESVFPDLVSSRPPGGDES